MRPGLVLLLLSGLSAAFHLWIARGVMMALPAESAQRIEYIFVSDSFGSLAWLFLLCSSALCAIHGYIRRTTRTQADRPALLSWSDAAYVLPLCAFAVSATALFNLIPASARVLSPLSYVVVDLRWWWSPLIGVWLVRNIDRRLGGRLRARSKPVFQSGVPTWWPELTIVALAVIWVVAGTPHLRFSRGTAGDEPKYVRHAELLYQGEAFELSGLRTLSELPEGFRPRLLRNGVRMAQALPDTLRSLLSDAATFVSDPSHKFNRASKSKGFLVGRNGGDYQVHTPGISFLMFPAYYLDRQFADQAQDADAQWPDRLPAVGTFFLSLYAVWVLLVFRFLRRLTDGVWIPWISTVALMFTMPVSAFPFQFYPEMAAGVIILWVAGHLTFSVGVHRGAAFFAGLLAGFLPWLHVRFSAVVVVLAVAGVMAMRKMPQRAAIFLAGICMTLGSMSLYAYHLTGSILPWSMWQEESGKDVLTATGAFWGAFAYLVDNEWGLFAHAPVYLLALPGYWWLAQRRRDLAWLCAGCFAALVLPAAGHTLHAAGGTPMRLIVAVVPFAGLPLAELLARRGCSPFVQAAFGLFLVLSLHTALGYNLHLLKGGGPLQDWTFSAWKIHLLLPEESRSPWEISRVNGWLYSLWGIAVVALAFSQGLIARAKSRATGLMTADGSRLSAATVGLIAVGLMVLLGTIVSAATGGWQHDKFRQPPRRAAQAALSQLDELDGCAACVSSVEGVIDAAAMEGKLSALMPDTKEEPVARRDYQEWLEMPGLIKGWYREAHGHEPASGDIGHYLFQWSEERVASEEIRRRIFRAADKPVSE